MEDHETRRKIIREWMALPKEKRQTEEQVAAFAKKAVQQNQFHRSRRDPSQKFRLGAKQLGLLRELVPNVTIVGTLVNPNNPTSGLTDAQAAAGSLGLQIHVLNANTEIDIDQAFASAIQQGVGALIVGADPFFYSRRDQIVALAARERVPTIYYSREFTAAGGLISYGASLTDGYHQAGTYTGRVLKGEKPADMPVMQLSKFELVINLKAAKALGLSIPSGVLAIADEVLE